MTKNNMTGSLFERHLFLWVCLGFFLISLALGSYWREWAMVLIVQCVLSFVIVCYITSGIIRRIIQVSFGRANVIAVVVTVVSMVMAIASWIFTEDKAIAIQSDGTYRYWPIVKGHIVFSPYGDPELSTGARWLLMISYFIIYSILFLVILKLWNKYKTRPYVKGFKS
ncbi:hypothetical protein HF324_09260 [Chitinophaga oryzae]|uniref:Uncharacterized protein n=1 Tax=Chitinophaga oryzae TaxID=2725414 RepID=A0AAE6ZEL3_9BACT|nr:hypothetical protein [Chitinophaga oryzae]QJB31550.1 hypothetical protein HF329_09610 [Chitinophaga oryzae]QJB38030.1 hypothetical protein HF324_09260 [Chitinophaga oryzae]